MLETANTLLATFAFTEVLLRGRPLRDVRWPVAAMAALSMVLSPRFHGLFFVVAAQFRPGGSAGGSLGEPSAMADHPAVSASADRVGSIAIGGSVAPLDAGRIAALGFSAAGLDGPIFRCAVRLTTVLSGLCSLAYLDVRRLRPQPYLLREFLRELHAALWLVLPVFPFLVMGFSFVFLVVSSVLTKIGLPPALGEELIFYGQFYAPFSAVYWIVKKDWLRTAEQPPLPLHAAHFATSGASVSKVK